MAPFDPFHLQAAGVLGSVTEHGGKTSHAAIVARALELPYVVGVKDLVGRVLPGALVVVDGARGDVVIDPSPEVLSTYRARAEAQRRRDTQLLAEKDLPALHDRRRRDSPARQRRVAAGRRVRGGLRRRGDRPLPDGVPVPRTYGPADRRRAIPRRAVGAERRRRVARDVPNAGSRRRQAPFRVQDAGGRQPRARRPLDPVLPRETGHLPHAAAGALSCVGVRAPSASCCR